MRRATTLRSGFLSDNYDGGKGLELIPAENVEVIFDVAPYLSHHNPAVHDGFGDTAFLSSIASSLRMRSTVTISSQLS